MELIHAIARLYLNNLPVALLSRINAIYAFFEALNPYPLLRVDVKPFHTGIDSHLCQFVRGIALKTLRHRVVDTVVHTLTHPQTTVACLEDTVDIVIAHGGGVAFVGVECLHTVAVIAVKAIGGANPHVAPRVFEDIIYL